MSLSASLVLLFLLCNLERYVIGSVVLTGEGELLGVMCYWVGCIIESDVQLER